MIHLGGLPCSHLIFLILSLKVAETTPPPRSLPGPPYSMLIFVSLAFPNMFLKTLILLKIPLYIKGCIVERALEALRAVSSFEGTHCPGL